MKCKKCGAEFKEGMFCPECGEKYVEDTTPKKKCKKCGAEFTEGNFCPECGTEYTEGNTKTDTKKVKADKKKTSKKSGGEKKKSKLPLIIGIVAVSLVGIAVLGSGSESESDSSVTVETMDLGDYLPKGKEDVMKLIKQTGLEEETPGFYTGEDLRIILDESGFIDTMTVKTPKNSLYGIRVGDDYSFEQFFDVLSDHSYVMMGEDESNAIWGITSGDQDRLIDFLLNSGKIGTIYFMRHGAYEQMELIQSEYGVDGNDTAYSSDLNTEDTVLETEAIEENGSANTAKNGSNIYGVYSQDFGRRSVYAEVGNEIDSDYDYLKLLNSPYAENESDEYSYYQIYSEDGTTWYAVDSKCVVYLSSDDTLEIHTPADDWTLYKQPDGTQMPTFYAETEAESENQANKAVISLDHMDDPDSYLCSWSDSEYMTEDQLQALDYRGARIVKNEIYARHGRKFNAPELQSYFSEKSWYNGRIDSADFDESVFNVYERANIKLIDDYMQKVK